MRSPLGKGILSSWIYLVIGPIVTHHLLPLLIRETRDRSGQTCVVVISLLPGQHDPRDPGEFSSSATETSRKGFFSLSFLIHSTIGVDLFLTCRLMAVDPTTSNRRRYRFPCLDMPPSRVQWSSAVVASGRATQRTACLMRTAPHRRPSRRGGDGFRRLG